MPQFYPLRVDHIERNTRDSVVLTLSPPDEARGAFNFIQGQYLTFRREFDGEEMRRSYSICAGLDDNILRVGIKKVDGGWFSSWANEELKEGETIEAMAPMGNFHAPLMPAAGRSYLGFAGGSGITPMISLIKTVLAREPQSHFTLIYGNRNAASVMFREELEDIKNTHMGRFNVLHILETEADIDLFSGLLTREKCDALFAHWVDVKRSDLAFICGPEPMMLAVADALKAHGMAEDAIKFELFKSPKAKKRKAKSADGAGAHIKARATIILDGASREIELTDEDTVLEAALAANIDAPYACKAGVCSTCRAKVIEGKAEMENNNALEDYEVERGYILTCQAHPQTERLMVDYDQ